MHSVWRFCLYMKNSAIAVPAYGAMYWSGAGADAEALTRDWFALVSDIKGFEASGPEQVQGSTDSTAKKSRQASGGGFVFDPDRMLSAFHVMLFACLCYLTLIYLEGIPGGSLVLMLGVPITMAMATMPHIPPSKLFVPAAGSVLFAGLIYIFIMPMISSFWGLGLLIFAVTFFICYLFAAPQQMLARALGLAMFIMISSIENLMSSGAIGYHSGYRCDSNKDLVGQGIGNLVAWIVFALSSAGSLVMPSGAGILASSDSPDAAAAFVEFLLSVEAQEYFARETFEYPLVPGVEPFGSLPPLDSIPAPDIDLSDLAPMLDLATDLVAEAGLL